MAAVVRAEALSGFEALVESLGGDPHALLRRRGITAYSLGEKRRLVPFPAFASLLEDAAYTLRCPDFALRLSQCWDASILGPLPIALRYSRSVMDLVECAKSYLFARSPEIALRIRPTVSDQRKLIEFRFEIGLKHAEDMRQALDACLAWLHFLVRALAPDLQGPEAIRVPHGTRVPVSRYQEHFSAQVCAGHPYGALVYPHELRALRAVDTPGPGGNVGLPQRRSRRQQSTWSQVQRVLSESLGIVPHSKGLVAEVLGVHPRTLQRYLKAEGTSYEAVREHVRRSEARRHISCHCMPMTQIATLVGASEASALTRSCKRWFGVTPRQLRSQLTAQPQTRATSE